MVAMILLHASSVGKCVLFAFVSFIYLIITNITNNRSPHFIYITAHLRLSVANIQADW